MVGDGGLAGTAEGTGVGGTVECAIVAGEAVEAAESGSKASPAALRNSREET